MNRIKEMNPEQEIKSDTLTSRTIGKLLEYIKEKEIGPGDLLPTEVELINILGVSRIVLREALSYLKGLGLITSRRGSGFKIAQVDFADTMRQALEHISVLTSSNLNELMELRSQLEIGSVYEAVENATDSDISNIFLVLKKLEEHIEKDEPSLEKYQAIELEFHQSIMRSADSKTLNIISSSIRNYFDAAIKKKKQLPADYKERITRELMEHRMIADAFALRWPDVAESCLRRHLHRNKPWKA